MKGFDKKKGVDFEEIFSHVVNMSYIWVVMRLATNLNLEIEQLDVKIAFLHSGLEEKVYMEQPKGLVSKVKKNKYASWRKVCMG